MLSWVIDLQYVNHKFAFEYSLSGTGTVQTKLRSRHNEKR